MVEVGRRFFALRAEMDNSVFEKGDHAVIDVSPFFAGIKENHAHRRGVLQDSHPFEGIQRRIRDLLFRLDTEEPFPHA